MTTKNKHLLYYILGIVFYVLVSVILFLTPISAVVEYAQGYYGWATFEFVTFFVIVDLVNNAKVFFKKHKKCYKELKQAQL